MNIAIVVPSLRSVGGAENVVDWLARDLAGRGHPVSVFTRDFSESVWGGDAHRPYAVRVIAGIRPGPSSTWIANRETGQALAAALSGHTFDVVNAHNHPASLWVHYAKAGGAALPPTVLFLHNLPGYLYDDVTAPHMRRLPGLRSAWRRFRPGRLLRRLRQALLGYRELDRAAVRSFDRVIANSRYAAEMARRIYSREVEACVLGVRRDESPGPAGSSRLGAAPGTGAPRVVLTVARIELQKNFDTLLAAIRILKAHREAADKPFRHVIVGGGPYLEHFRARSRRLGIDDVVAFTGSVPHERVRSLYDECAFVVHIPLDEPFGLVPLEAALCGKASIVSGHGGPAEAVVDGVTGVHVDALDPSAVAEKIRRLLDHPAEASEMGERARTRVMEHYAWSRFVDAFERHLERAVGSV